MESLKDKFNLNSLTPDELAIVVDNSDLFEMIMKLCGDVYTTAYKRGVEDTLHRLESFVKIVT